MIPGGTILCNIPSLEKRESTLSMTTMSTAINDSEDYYCFRLMESIDSERDENIIIPRLPNFSLDKLRRDLYKQFGVPQSRRIFYIDDDGDDVPIDSECEFYEALKLAKNAFVANTAIPLIVGEMCGPGIKQLYNPICSDDEQYFNMSEVSGQNKKSKSISGNQVSSEKNSNFISNINSEFIKQKRPIRKILPKPKKLNIRRCESSEKQTESEDIEFPRQLNTKLPYHSNTVPPPWFIEYMEAMKKDMISTITHEVEKNVTEILNKRLDAFAYPLLKQLNQLRSQSHSLPKRHPKCSFDSAEKNQKRTSSQDEEQSSDTSIERVDEPQNINIAEDLQTSKDMISTISQEVVKEMTEMLNRIPLESRNQSHLSSSERFLRYFDLRKSNERNQRKMKFQDKEQSSDDASERAQPRGDTNITDISRQTQKKLDKTENFKVGKVMKEEKTKKKRIVQAVNGKNSKEQSSQNNTQKDSVSNSRINSIPYNETQKLLENELRMSCSVTGHQILDKSQHAKNAWSCDNSEIDKTNFWLCDREMEDDDAFEIIQMPPAGSKNESTAIEQRRRDSNGDSPSFELLSDPPSPTPACFMHFNEEHFSANEGNASQLADTNPSRNSVYVVDIHGKIYNKRQSTVDDEHVNADLEKRSGGTYSFIAETLPIQDVYYSKSLYSEQNSSERKNDYRDDVRDNASGTYDDVKNSHTSYLTVPTHCDLKTQCSCQSQTDSNDFTQSFHSHTTSVTDTTDIYTEAYDDHHRKYNEGTSTTVKDVREPATASTSKNNRDAYADGSCKKEGRANERHYSSADNYSKRSCGLHNDTSRDLPHQSNRTNGTSSSNGLRKTSGGKTSGPANNAILLPTLPLATAVVILGSYVYDSACEMLDKIRAHTREEFGTPKRSKARR